MRTRYSTTLAPASHWSLRLRRGLQMTLTDVAGGANVGMLFYNPSDLLEKYNAPDTLKCQHTFKLTQGHCLYSDMGRIFCSITQDSLGWHETGAGNINAQKIKEKFGGKNYQQARNDWQQNGYDSFLVELAKYGLGPKDMAANLNLFSKVVVDEQGDMTLVEPHSKAGDSLTLRFEMDTLVIMHTCPHPMTQASVYPRTPVKIDLSQADPVAEDDLCMNHCPENQRGFKNNELYYL